MTPDQIKRLAPDARPDYVQALLDGWPAMWSRGINTPLRLCHFMAQIAHECGGFTIVEENLNYSAERLMQVWPTHFRSLAFAQQYARNPQALANFIYADVNRPPSARLGNIRDGDGWRYRGRSFLQTTGRDNYRSIGHEADPEALREPTVGLDAAIYEFVGSGCLKLADADDLLTITRRINGGTIGLAERGDLLARAKRIFTSVSEPDMVTSPQKPAPVPHVDVPVPVPLPEPHIPPAQPHVDPLPEPLPPPAPGNVAPVVAGGFIAAALAAVAGLWEPIANWFHHLFGG